MSDFIAPSGSTQKLAGDLGGDVEWGPHQNFIADGKDILGWLSCINNFTVINPLAPASIAYWRPALLPRASTHARSPRPLQEQDTEVFIGLAYIAEPQIRNTIEWIPETHTPRVLFICGHFWSEVGNSASHQLKSKHKFGAKTEKICDLRTPIRIPQKRSHRNEMAFTSRRFLWIDQ